MAGRIPPTSCLKPGGDPARHCRRTEVRGLFAGHRDRTNLAEKLRRQHLCREKLRDQSRAEVRRKWVGRQEKNKREEEGNSCGKRELWNNLAAPRSLTSLEFSRPGNRFGISYLRRLEVTS